MTGEEIQSAREFHTVWVTPCLDVVMTKLCNTLPVQGHSSVPQACYKLEYSQFSTLTVTPEKVAVLQNEGPQDLA